MILNRSGRARYGDDYQYDAPVTLLERMLHGLLDNPGEEVVVLSQVLGADINVGSAAAATCRCRPVPQGQGQELLQ